MSENENIERGAELAPGDDKSITRRQFLTGVGGAGLGVLFGGFLVNAILLPDEVIAIPVSQGYLLVDTQKCSGCTSCMLACALVHHGETSLSLSRIQVNQDSLGKYPTDITIAQCRQCPFPPCVDACPTGALHADDETGVRTVDTAKCIGCQRCVNACPFAPARALWNFDEKHAQKCDLCLDTPFWDEKGGPDGVRACESVCSMRAIKFTSEIPVQSDEGYVVDLRTGTAWDSRFWGAVGATGVAGSGQIKK